MWWSKQAGPATLSFSPSFSSTGTIDAPAESPASNPSTKSSYPSVTRTDRAPQARSNFQR